MPIVRAMDLGCLDLGCISPSERQRTEAALGSEKKDGDVTNESSPKFGKNKASKDTNPLALNRFTSQIKKPPHRKSSPLNWFPRKKVDSYLKRKIKMLQEVEGMNLTLEETLGDSNPHYSKVLREKIAAQEAVHKAMVARKAALVEASWCRILQAARIQSKEAEAVLLEAEKNAEEAFESATALGIIVYDIPNCPKKDCEIQMSSVSRGGSTTHNVMASFETAFEVDKQVAAAVKSALIKLANCPSFNKDEFRDILRKINENPDTSDTNQDYVDFSSECESESGLEHDTVSWKNDGFNSEHFDCSIPVSGSKQRKSKRRQSLEKFTMENLVETMLSRLKCLQDDELSSLATIVATCGLNAALAEAESKKLHNQGSGADYPSASTNFPRRMSSLGADGQMRRKQVDSELPSLDKFLVKHMTKLEREVHEAKKKKNESRDEPRSDNDKVENRMDSSQSSIISSQAVPQLESILVKHTSKFEKDIQKAKENFTETFKTGQKMSENGTNSFEAIPDLGKVLVKHVSKLEKEIQEAKRNPGTIYVMNAKKEGNLTNGVPSDKTGDISDIPSLDKFLVKHVSRLEREVEEAKNRRKNDLLEVGRKADLEKRVQPENSTFCTDGEGELVGKVSMNFGSAAEMNIKKEGNVLNEVPSHMKGDNSEIPSLDKFLVKHVSRLEREVEEAKNRRKNDQVEGDRVANLEKKVKLETKAFSTNGGEQVEKENINLNAGETPPAGDAKAGRKNTEESLDRILVKPVHRLEREKMQALSSSGSNYGNTRNQKKQGGTDVTELGSLDEVLVKHVSKLEREKMRSNANEEVTKVKKGNINMTQMNEESSLEKLLVKHKSGLEREKMVAAEQPVDQIKPSVARREARERELQRAWGGLSLGNSIRPHLSKLEREKAAWIKAEEEERNQPMKV